MTSKLRHDDNIRLKQERPFMRAVAREKNRFTRAANDSYKVYGQVSESVIEQHRANMIELFNQRYKRAVRVFARDMQNFKSVNQMLTKNEDIIDDIFQAYLAAYGFDSVRQVVNTGIAQFQAFALSAYGQGFSTREIEAMLRGQYGFNAWRAATIARTEVGKVASFTQVEIVKRASIETGAVFTKKWIPFLDDRTRINHAGMNDHPAIPMEEKFNVGGELLDRPRDPNGSAGNVINCRCTLIFEEV